MKDKDTQVSESIRFFLKNAKRFSLLILLGFTVLGAIAAFSVSKLRTEYSMRQFLPDAHPLMNQDDAVRKRFQIPEMEPFFVLITLPEKSDGTWLEPHRIAKLRDVSPQIQAQEGVTRVISLANVEGASSTKEGLTVGALLELTPPEKWEERVMKDPLLTPHLISHDGRTLMVAVGMLEKISQNRSIEIQHFTRKALAETYPGAKIRIGGIPAVQGEMTSILSKELRNFLALSLIASLMTLLLFFRSVSSIMVPLFLMLLANFVCLAWMAWTGVSFTVLSSTLPVLVALTVVSMCSHTMLRYANDWALAVRSQENPNPIRVLMHSYRGLMLPNFLTAVTTAIGFFAISFAKIPLIQQYGITVGISIFLCWFVVIVTLFPLLILFPVPQVREWTESRATWAIWLTQHNKKVLLGVGALCAVALYFGKDLNWSAKLFDDLPHNHEARNTTEFIDSKLGGMIPLYIVIEGKEENAWNDPIALAKVDDLAKRWRGHQAVGSVVGPSDFVRAAGKVQGRDIASTRQEAAEYSFLYSFSDENPFKQYVTADGRAARLNLRLHDIPADQMEKVKNAFLEEAKVLFPDWKVTAAGMATTVHALNKELCEELIFGFWQALFLIGVILGFVFRSVRWTLVACLPNLVPVVVLLGALNLGGTPIKPGIALIFSIALGISFDNTVYLLGRLRLLRDRSAEKRISVAKAWFQEGNLCLYSSVALSAGFLVFLASFFTLNQQFGVYMLVAILGGLLGDLILLPAMLAAFPWMLKNRKKPDSIKENNMPGKAIATSLAVALFLGAASNAYAAQVDPNNAKALLDQVEKNVTSKDEVATVKMVITEADGTKKNRELEIRRKGEDEAQKVLVRMQGPADLKGTALLSVSKGKSSDQWLYLPSSKQTRRIQSGKKSSSFMDSELSYEDMGTSSDAQFESKVVGQKEEAGRKFSIVENTPKGESSYGKILVWVDLQNYLVGKMEYFDKAGKPLKVSTFSGYKQFDKGVWRAQKIAVTNMQNKRGTTLELSDLKLNKGLDDEEFSESALTEGD